MDPKPPDLTAPLGIPHLRHFSSDEMSFSWCAVFPHLISRAIGSKGGGVLVFPFLLYFVFSATGAYFSLPSLLQGLPNAYAMDLGTQPNWTAQCGDMSDVTTFWPSFLIFNHLRLACFWVNGIIFNSHLLEANTSIILLFNSPNNSRHMLPVLTRVLLEWFL